MEVFKAVPAEDSYVWQPLACDGTDLLGGVGDVRVMGYAKWTGPKPKANETFRFLYQATSSWYVDVNPMLPSNVEVTVLDVVQDLSPSSSSHRLKFKGNECNITATNIPSRSEALKSHRTTPTDLIENIRIEIRKYSTDEVIPCGSSVTGTGRVKVRVFVTNDAAATMDFHAHQERPASIAQGPSQEGDPATHRWWEFGADEIRVAGGVETMVLFFTASTQDEGKNTFHAAQQHPTEQHDVEGFCSFTNTPN